jgi:predicted dehydrogenase
MDLRAAIVGTGEQGGYHARAYQDVPAVNVVAVCDIVPERAEAFARTYGLAEGAVFGSISKLLAHHEIDLWSICTPTAAHAPNAMEILHEQRPPLGILCEKPPCMNMMEFHSMTAQAELLGVVLTFGFHLRYTAAEWLARVIRAGNLGEVYHVDAMWHRRAGTPLRGVFTQQRYAGGGPGMDLLPHVLDLAYLLVGREVVPASVTASAHTRLAEQGGTGRNFDPSLSDVEDTIIGHVKMASPDGVTVTFAASWEGHIDQDRLTVEVRGTEGGARLDLMRTNGTEFFVPKIYTQLEGEAVEASISHPERFRTVEQCYAAEITDLANAVRCRNTSNGPVSTPQITTQQAGVVMNTIFAAYESVASGETVTLLPDARLAEVQAIA